jgi:hypothetical protein
MTRSVFPFYASDISELARSLQNQLTACDHTPGHVELLNMLARSIGSRNFQHFRAKMVAEKRLLRPGEALAPIDYAELQSLSRYFDVNGRWVRWPTKFSHQEPCLWVLWSKVPPRKTFSERQINELLLANHLFDDPALLRREMKEHRMLTRTIDGRVYRRVERKPPPVALALIRFLGGNLKWRVQRVDEPSIASRIRCAVAEPWLSCTHERKTSDAASLPWSGCVPNAKGAARRPCQFWRVSRWS